MDVKKDGLKLLSHLDLKRYRNKFPREEDLQDEWEQAKACLDAVKALGLAQIVTVTQLVGPGGAWMVKVASAIDKINRLTWTGFGTPGPGPGAPGPGPGPQLLLPITFFSTGNLYHLYPTQTKATNLPSRT